MVNSQIEANKKQPKLFILCLHENFQILGQVTDWRRRQEVMKVWS